MHHARVQISIHLMLLFIGTAQGNFTEQISFQYISCYCLSKRADWYWRGRRISIHLMLLFIPTTNAIKIITLNFNTSHVTVYQQQRLCYWCICFISIHLMLLFIGLFMEKHYRKTYISIHLMLLFILHQILCLVDRK